MPRLFSKLRAQSERLKRDLTAMYLAARDPRTPWYAKVVLGCVVAYALSPIDLIPDFIPILGYLDDVLLLPLGIYIAINLIPPEILNQCRAKAAAMNRTLPRSWRAAVSIALLWFIALALAGYFLIDNFLPLHAG
jgi:uncharacterized membrane protein YkvA (DUF1232 family)